MKARWLRQGQQGAAWVSFLKTGAAWDPAEFHLTGVRFVDRMLERLRAYGCVDPTYCSAIEIGCGIGRFLRPLACRFKSVVGVDFSDSMLERAAQYCEGLPNVTLLRNDGASLVDVPDGAHHVAISAGVFQHITRFELITAYVREALRVLSPGGLFLFQFEGNRSRDIGAGNVGARITARGLSRELRGAPFAIREVSNDPADPVRNVVVVLERTNTPNLSPDFSAFPRTQQRWLLGVYDDVATATSMHDRLRAPAEPFTFDDQ